MVCVCARMGKAPAVATWLEEGGGVDASCVEYDGKTLLMEDAYGEQVSMVRMLLRRGTSVNLLDHSSVYVAYFFQFSGGQL